MTFIFLTVCILAAYLLTLRKEKPKSLNKMYNCFDIADYLLKKAREEGQGRGRNTHGKR